VLYLGQILEGGDKNMDAEISKEENYLVQKCNTKKRRNDPDPERVKNKYFKNCSRKKIRTILLLLPPGI